MLQTEAEGKQRGVLLSSVGGANKSWKINLAGRLLPCPKQICYICLFIYFAQFKQ